MTPNPGSDLLPFKHGEDGDGSTHYVCNERLELFGMKAVCCGCTKHECVVKGYHPLADVVPDEEDPGRDYIG